MKKLNRKIKKILLASSGLASILGVFTGGIFASESIKENIQHVKEFSEKKEGIATYSGLSGALLLPSMIYGFYKIVTRKKRKLKDLEIEKHKLEIFDLEKKLRGE